MHVIGILLKTVSAEACKLSQLVSSMRHALLAIASERPSSRTGIDFEEIIQNEFVFSFTVCMSTRRDGEERNE